MKHKTILFSASISFMLAGIGLTSIVHAEEQNFTPENSIEVQFRSAEANYPDARGGSTLGRWEYMYTIEPFAFFKNTKTGAITNVQVTSTVEHTVNNIVNGWVTRGPNYNFPYYNPAHRHLMN
ncbi:hypothetical protein [Streptococcus ruminantium]|uniref:hypothetical protein n=1 Tax=Streptococcus ruminantium TaxID=1917441 RepID=UPI000E71CC1E|nr:hypothetical protein [Streptococcus ruminantium]